MLNWQTDARKPQDVLIYSFNFFCELDFFSQSHLAGKKFKRSEGISIRAELFSRAKEKGTRHLCDRVHCIHFHLKILSDLGVEAESINFPLILRVTKHRETCSKRSVRSFQNSIYIRTLFNSRRVFDPTRVPNLSLYILLFSVKRNVQL
jgi:hypothetical protein